MTTQAEQPGALDQGTRGRGASTRAPGTAPAASRGRRPFWLKAVLTVEWVACGIAVLLGVLFLYFELSYSGADTALDGWLVGLGLGLVILGPLNVALTLWLSSAAVLAGAQRWLLGLLKTVTVLLLLPVLIAGLLLVAVVAVFAIAGVGQVFPGAE